MYIVGEIGINHNGSIKLAKELINIAYNSNCNGVKFQKRTIDLVYSKEELNTPRDSPWGTTNREQKEGLEFSIEGYKELEKYSKDLGLDFIMSCWDLESIKLVNEHLDVDYHKIPSALLTDKDFLIELNKTNVPIILSTGMSNEEQIGLSIKYIKNNLKYILACTSTYPTKPEEINLKHILNLKIRYPNYKIGFSNHYSGGLACYGATVMGAEMIEFHITKDRTMYGSDQPASIEHVNDIVIGINIIEKMIGDGNKKIYETEVPIINKLRKNNTI